MPDGFWHLRRRRSGLVLVITGTGPVLAAMAAGDNLNTKATWGSYTSSAGTINNPTVKEYTKNGGAWTTFGSLILLENDVIILRETVTDSAGNVRSFFSNIDSVEPGIVLENTVLPEITGITIEGEALTSTLGTWTGIAPITYERQWSRNGVLIPGATAGTYTLVSADVGATITITVTATNIQGSAEATSPPTDMIVAAGQTPTNTVAPVITGTPTEGQTLTVSDGTWTGTAPITYSRVWRQNGVAIPGAAGSTFVLTNSQVDRSITCTVTATNANGAASVTTAPTALVAAAGTILIREANGSVTVVSIEPVFAPALDYELDGTITVFQGA